MLYANLRPRVRLNINTHVKRTITNKGELSARVGMEVTPDDILGVSRQSAGFMGIKLASLLRVSPTDALKYLQRGVGESIYKGELLALRKTLLGKVIVTAPTDGVIDQYNPERGELKLRYLPKKVPLYAGVFGIVDAVNPVIGEVLVKTVVTEIIGVFGAGLERGGQVHIISGPNALIAQEQITAKLNTRIVVGGAIIYGETLRKALEVGVYGIVSGGLNARDFKAMSGQLDPMLRVGTTPGISILSTEGFGVRQIGEDIFNKVKEYDGKFAFLHGNSSRLWLPSIDPDSIMALRKVVLPVRRTPEQSSEILSRQIKLGDWIRIIWPPYAGWQGKVVAIDGSPTKLPSGISTYVITVETRLKKIKVPFPNIELINEKS